MESESGSEPEVFLRSYSRQEPARINILHMGVLPKEELNEPDSLSWPDGLSWWTDLIPFGQVFGKRYKNVTIQTQVGFQ